VIVRFSPAATQELVEARAWYDERREGLGDEFQHSFEAAADAIAEHPEQYAVIYKTRRRVFIRRFPYFLLYEVLGDTVLVLGCIHCARDPAVWQSRRET
jgi:plasmid stabilization system protein ParE